MALFNSYQPYQVYNPYQQYYAQAQTQQQTPQIQNGGFVLVKDIEEAEMLGEIAEDAIHPRVAIQEMVKS